MKVLKNLQKLDKKRKKMFANLANSKSSLNVYNLDKTEKSELGTTVYKNSSVVKSGSKNHLASTSSLMKTQRKPKTKKIRTKAESPSKILSSDSEMEDMSPKHYLDYCNLMSQLNSENTEKYKMMSLKEDLQNENEYNISDRIRDMEQE